MSTWIFVFFLYQGNAVAGVQAPGVVPDLKSHAHCLRVRDAMRRLEKYKEGFCLEVKP